MPEPRASTIVLLGMMGAGKSTVGRALAARTGWRYLDNDQLVAAATGRAAEEIDASDGTGALHEAESAALRHALSLPPPLIAGAAAWVVEDEPSLELLRRTPKVVYLRARPETLRRRIGSGSGRRSDATDLAWLRARHAERDAAYRRAATVTLDTDELDPPAIAHQVLTALGLAERRD
jgi:shikimate kinase